jgi:hypothetical protein
MKLLRSLLFELRIYLGNYPFLFFNLYGLKKKNKKLFIKNDTELVIAAYPRTGNTFFVVALQYIQKQPISIAHHLHVPALALEGVKRKLPVVVLIRNPKDAIVSLLIRETHISIDQALRAYIQFHEPLIKDKENILVIGFDQFTEDFQTAVSCINSRFNLNLDNYTKKDPFNKELVFNEIENINKTFNKNKLVETMVSRPSDSRRKAKELNLKLLEQNKYKTKLDECIDIYDELISR